MIFCSAQWDQAEALKNILHKYELGSGQTINFAKTDVVFCKGVLAKHRIQITSCLGIQEVLSLNKFLGAPTFAGRSRKEPISFSS